MSINDILSQIETADVISTLVSLTELVVFYVGETYIKPNKKLKKDFKIGHITTVDLPSDIIRKYDEFNEEEILKKQCGESIMKFIEVVIKEIPEVNLTIMLNNLNELKVKTNSLMLMNLFTNSSSVGSYNVKENKIKVSRKNKQFSTIYHELFHAITTIIDKKTGRVYCGFEQTVSNKIIGRGLNEGYTTHLTKKYFNPDDSGYPYETRITSILEQIIGESTMRKYYFSADLKGLIDYLKKYISEEETYKFLQSLDLIERHLASKHLTEKSIDILSECLKSINLYLIKLKLSKTIVDNQKIQNADDDKIVLSLVEITQLIPYSLCIGKQEFNMADNEIISESYNEIMEKYNLQKNDWYK